LILVQDKAAGFFRPQA